jgi:hypothetical protein
MAIEDEFGFEIPDGHGEKLLTPQQIARKGSPLVNIVKLSSCTMLQSFSSVIDKNILIRIHTFLIWIADTILDLNPVPDLRLHNLE